MARMFNHPLGRMFNHPELLFILLVAVLPLPVAFLWSTSGLGFLARLLAAMAAGLLIWLLVIVLIVWPRYRH